MRLLLLSPKNVYATRRLQEEALKQDTQITLIDVQGLVQAGYDIDPVSFDAFYIRQAYVDFNRQAAPEHLQKIIDLAQRFQAAGKKVIDRAIVSGDLGAGKYESLLRLKVQGISVPQTRLLSDSGSMSFPEIAKWNYGFGAKHTYLLQTPHDLGSVRQKYPSHEILIQEFVPADFEYKVITIGYKSLPILLRVKIHASKFLPDLKQYQVLPVSDTSPDLSEVIGIAERASRILRRELAKVDILQVGDRFYVLEVNRWPGLEYFEKTSKYNVAGDFLRYIQARL